MKKCLSKAHEGQNPLPESEFYKNRAEEDGLADYCKTCSRKAVKKTLDKRPKVRVYYTEQESKLRRQQSLIARKYNLTTQEVEKMYKSQNGQCAICLYPIGTQACQAPNPYCVDHNHATGKVRGLLCRNCNSGLGKFRDNITTLQQAISYLQQSLSND